MLLLNQLNKAAYIKSYKQAAEDADIMHMTEEGMADYLSDVKHTENGE